MKTLFISFLLIGVAQFSNSQTDLAYTATTNMDLKNNTIKTTAAPELRNSITANFLDKNSRRLEQQVLQYDIKNATVYAPYLKTTYSVSFTEGNNRIDAIYDADGTLIQSEGAFENVSVPYVIGYQLAKKYPGWEFHKSWCTSSYSLDNDAEIIYKIQLKKGHKTKIVKVNPLENDL